MNNNNSKPGEKYLLLVNTGLIKKKFIIQRLKALNFKLVVLNKEKNWAEPYVDHWILADTFNHQEVIQNIKLFMAANPGVKIGGAITFWEDDVLLVSKIIDKFNLIGIPFNLAKTVRNKFLFREFCRTNGLPAPQYKLIKKQEDLKKISQTFKFPMVIKPVYGSSSAYVVKVENEDELFNTYQYIKNNISTTVESALTEGLEVLVEEYIDGDEVDIDILLQNGKIKFYSITDNYRTNEPFFIETGFSIPSSLPLKSQTELFVMAEDVLEKLGVQNGCIHFEAKAAKNGPVPIEINLRMGGDEVYSFMKGAWNVDMIDLAAKIALGVFIKVKKPEVPRKYFTGQDFLTEDSGILVTLDIDEKLKQQKYLEELHFYKQIGDPVLAPPEGYEYLGWITVAGDNLLDAEDNLKEALKFINYSVAKFDTESAFGKTSRKNRFSSAVLRKNLVLKAAKIEQINRTAKQDLKNLRIGIGYNLYSEGAQEIQRELTTTALAIEQALKAKGYQASLIDFNNFIKAFNELKKGEIDLFFNLAEQINFDDRQMANIPAILDALQIPYTGSSAFTLHLAKDKIRAKKLLSFHNIPTPKWDYAFDLEDEIDPELEYPLIIKPGNADKTFGISNESIVTNKKDLDKMLKRIIVEYQSPALVEEYIEGDEYDVSILGSEFEDLEVLPLIRSIFKDLPKRYWRIYTLEAKFSSKPVYHKIKLQQPAKNISKKLETLITEIALDTYNIMDCQDYGQVEIRVDKDNNPYVLELNPNPSLAEKAFLPRAAKLINLQYPELLEEIISLAINRYKRKTMI
ncbi:ATP-grasp domain-containing protein [Patescibacteria group bacterium]|nr:ATP-grasp domain-containing protein [Patescibacteria group bacterium]